MWSLPGVVPPSRPASHPASPGGATVPLLRALLDGGLDGFVRIAVAVAQPAALAAST